MGKKIRASVILIKNEKVLVMNSRYSSGKTIFLLPGGGVEEYETVENAAIREVKEETNLDITLVHLVTYNQYLDKKRGKDVFEIIFLGKIIRGGEETHLNDPSEGDHIISIEWLTYEELCKKEFYPKKVLENLKAFLGKNKQKKF